MFVFVVVVAVVGLGFVHKGPYPPILAGRREEGWGTQCELNGCETDDFGVANSTVAKQTTSGLGSGLVGGPYMQTAYHCNNYYYCIES